MKLLMIDIETAPHSALVWRLWDQKVTPKQIQSIGYTLCWAAKWYKTREVMFMSTHADGAEAMVHGAWDLLNEADAVIHYNGTRFDVPTLNKEFIKIGLTPPRPYKQIDLLKVCRQQFHFHSNALDEVLRYLDMPQKLAHKGMDLWVECMDGDPKAWRIMERYNRRDVTTMERLYKKLLPWISQHPNYAMYTDENRPVCTNCGGKKLTKQGTAKTKTHLYRQYKCYDCGTWVRDVRNSTPRAKRDAMKVRVT